jgi:hypothetical protein
VGRADGTSPMENELQEYMIELLSADENGISTHNSNTFTSKKQKKLSIVCQNPNSYINFLLLSLNNTSSSKIPEGVKHKGGANQSISAHVAILPESKHYNG